MLSLGTISARKMVKELTREMEKMEMEVWNKTDDKLILLKRKLLCWKEVSSRDSCGFVVG